MRAVIRPEYGGPEVLRVGEVPDPAPGDGQVLIRVKAAGVNMAEWHLMAGEPKAVRLAFGLPRPKRTGLGEDVAGVVAAVGPGVTRFAVGDEVVGSGVETWAELAVADENLLATKPRNLTFAEAAALPMSAYTARQALAVVGDIAGRQVAVTGAGGGVGSMLVQLARLRGAHVVAICSESKASFVSRLGATEVIDYRTTDVTAGQRRFHAVFDFAGGLPLRRWKRVIQPGGVLVLGGDENGGTVLGPLGRAVRGMLLPGLRTKLLVAATSGSDVAAVARLAETGEIVSTLTRDYPLEEAGRAVADLRAARHPGKLVLLAG